MKRHNLSWALLFVFLPGLSLQADLVGKYDANLGVELDGDEVTNWEDQVGGYDLDDSISPPGYLTSATPNGSAAIDFDPEINSHLSGVLGPGSDFPLVDATALTAAVVFSPDGDPELGDNDPNNPNFWGHPQLASGDRGGSHSDWGFSWGEDQDGNYNIWFGTGPDDGVPTVTASGAEPSGEGNTDVWYIGVGTWDADMEIIGAYLYDMNGGLIDSNTLDVPSATEPRIDIGFSTGAERPNLQARNYDGQIAVIELYDNWVDADGANAIASKLQSDYLGSAGPIGDFNGNGELDAADIDLLTGAIANGNADAQFDVNGDGAVNDDDRTTWVVDLANTYFGDANFDGEFSSGDFVQVFTSGKYENGQPANWAEGDWNGDGEFTSGDFVAAFSGGGYEEGPRPPAAVPEPSAWVLLTLGLLSVGRLRIR